MIPVRLYAAPLPAGVALVVAGQALADLRGTGALLASIPAPVRVDILGEADALAAEAREAARVLLRQAAVLATFEAGEPPAGPRGAWYGALVAWGWLLLFASSQVPLQVIGGLWLAAGLPWARRGWRRRVAAWGARSAAGLRGVVDPAEVRGVSHAGLVQLGTLVRAVPEARGQGAAYRQAAARCPDLGLADLAPFYQALAAGRRPGGVWTLLLPSAQSGPGEATGEAAPAAPVRDTTTAEAPATPAHGPAGADEPGAPDRAQEPRTAGADQPGAAAHGTRAGDGVREDRGPISDGGNPSAEGAVVRTSSTSS